MDAAFPQLVALEKKFGSLFSGLNGGKSILQVLRDEVKPAESPFVSLKRGLGSLIEALLKQLPEECVRLAQRVDALLPPENDAYPSVVVSGKSIRARHVIVAGPPWAARALLQDISPRAGDALGSVRGFATATVFFGLDERLAQPSFEGSGFIVPPGEAEILASTFISSKWDHRAPAGKALVRAFVGGGRKDIRGLSDGELSRLAHRELSRLLGDLGPTVFCRVHRYERGTPQPELGYREILSEVFSVVDELPWLSLVGSGYGGVGIPDCIRQAGEVAGAVASSLSQS
jgi:oxygen-dependent protoporphyrinogen oxidase